jgi:hypothetical protein
LKKSRGFGIHVSKMALIFLLNSDLKRCFSD